MSAPEWGARPKTILGGAWGVGRPMLMNASQQPSRLRLGCPELLAFARSSLGVLRGGAQSQARAADFVSRSFSLVSALVQLNRSDSNPPP